MSWNRNHWCTLGFFILFVGIQFHLVDNVLLTPDATEFIAEVTKNDKIAAKNSIEAISGADIAVAPYPWAPPDAIPHTLLTAGFILVFASLSMRKPA